MARKSRKQGTRQDKSSEATNRSYLAAGRPPQVQPDSDADSSGVESTLTVVVVDDCQAFMALDFDDWSAATLLACLSEDPASWSEVGLVWPRYRTSITPEFADALPLSVVDFDAAWSHLHPEQPWLVVDLASKRIFCGAGHDEVLRDGWFAMGEDEGFDPKHRIAIHLPPWWEIHNAADPADVRRPRTAEIRIPDCRRDVLWGEPLDRGLAELLVAAAGSDAWRQAGAANDEEARYRFTVQVHRDWLMTPREDLGGRMVRECLHGGMSWMDRVVEGQQFSISQQRGPIPIPCELRGYATAPMGRSEICMYFDACRELIDTGWHWLLEQPERRLADEDCASQLAGVLAEALHRWLHAPFEGGSPPLDAIRAERGRIPLLLDRENHSLDCDCPLCDMMADGIFGPTFVGIDGHHLELDDEFAFSLCETREEWEDEQRDYQAMSAAIEAKSASGPETQPDATDEFASSWQNSYVDPGGIPGDSSGHLTIGFRLADIIGRLQHCGNCQEDIDTLNQAFRTFRHADPQYRSVAAEAFKQALEQTAQHHDFLVSRAADLQSTLDELVRVR